MIGRCSIGLTCGVGALVCIPLGFGAGLVAGWAGSKAGADAGDAINDMAGW